MPVDLSGHEEWPPMIWVGGAQGAGKSTWSWQLSRAHDLPLHAIDLWAYDHQARLPAGGSLDDELARGPEAAADAFESVSRLRLELLLDDIRARELSAVPALVEGPQLMPGFAGELPHGWGVWLVPDPGRTRLAREERLAKAESLGGRTVAASSRVHRLLERDAVIAGRVRASALHSGRPVIEVPAVPDWPATAAAAESAIAPALRFSAAGLAPGRELSRQRRYENRAADRQGRLWMGDAGLTVAPSYPFGCECGTSGCRATWTGTPDEYAARTADERPLIAHRRTV
jgi:hypothetical protein